MHNELPHDVKFPAAATRLHQGIADVADAVHIMNSCTPAVVAATYEIPAEKIVVIPHPSYAGVYGPRLDAREAVRILGGRQSDEELVRVLFLGQIRPYKGVDSLFDAVEALARSGRAVELLLGGRTTDDLTGRLGELAAAGVSVVSHLGYVPDDDLPTWLSAADVVVLPYRKVLNSGSLHLAATYGVPVLLPDERHLRVDYGAEAWVRFFDPTSPSESIEASLRETWFRDDAVREAALAFSRRLLPGAISRRYADLVADLEAGSFVSTYEPDQPAGEG